MVDDQFKLDIDKIFSSYERSREDIIEDVTNKCKHVSNIDVLKMEVLLDIRSSLNEILVNLKNRED